MAHPDRSMAKVKSEQEAVYQSASSAAQRPWPDDESPSNFDDGKQPNHSTQTLHLIIRQG